MSRDFILWLDGYLDNVPSGFGLNKDKTQKVMTKLNTVFRHEIDPQEDKGRNPAELRKIHSGPWDPEQKDMC